MRDHLGVVNRTDDSSNDADTA